MSLERWQVVAFKWLFVFCCSFLALTGIALAFAVHRGDAEFQALSEKQIPPIPDAIKNALRDSRHVSDGDRIPFVFYKTINLDTGRSYKVVLDFGSGGLHGHWRGKQASVTLDGKPLPIELPLYTMRFDDTYLEETPNRNYRIGIPNVEIVATIDVPDKLVGMELPLEAEITYAAPIRNAPDKGLTFSIDEFTERGSLKVLALTEDQRRLYGLRKAADGPRVTWLCYALAIGGTLGAAALIKFV